MQSIFVYNPDGLPVLPEARFQLDRFAAVDTEEPWVYLGMGVVLVQEDPYDDPSRWPESWRAPSRGPKRGAVEGDEGFSLFQPQGESSALTILRAMAVAPGARGACLVGWDGRVGVLVEHGAEFWTQYTATWTTSSMGALV